MHHVQPLACGREQEESKILSPSPSPPALVTGSTSRNAILTLVMPERTSVVREGLSPSLSREAALGPHHGISQPAWSLRCPEQH